MGFNPHIAESPRILIESCYRRVFCRSGSGNQAVHEMNFHSSVAVQSVEMNRHLVDLNSMTRNKRAKRRSNVSTCLPIERLKYIHALGQNGRQELNHHVAAVASLEQPSSGPGMLFMILYEITDNQIGV